MRQFQSLTGSAENHRMVADRVARAHREHTDLTMRAHAGDPLSPKNCLVGQVLASCRRNRAPESQSRATRRIDLGAMMNLDHFGVEVFENRRDLADDLR